MYIILCIYNIYYIFNILNKINFTNENHKYDLIPN